MTTKKLPECRHVVYCKPAKEARLKGVTDDFHFAKVIEYDDEGKPRPDLKVIKNYKRPFWITKPGCRNHKDKKEFEDINRLEMYTCKQGDLRDSVVKALNLYVGKNVGFKEICNNPYIYGADIPSTSIIKHTVNSKNSEMSPYTVAVYDIETNMFSEAHETFLASITFKDKALLAVNRSFFDKHIPDTLSDQKEIDDFIASGIIKECHKWLKEDLTKRKINLEIALVDTEIDVVKSCIGKAHEWKPDILTGWNVVFDIKEAEAACKRAGVDIADIFCDPIVPKTHRKFVIQEGKEQRTTASGVSKSQGGANQWVTFDFPATFEIHDAMRDFKFVRTGQPEQLKYSLDYTLKKQIKRNKLKTGSVTTEDGTEWHRQMQMHFPFEYCAYNLFDCISVELLDEKTKDMAFAVPALIRSTIYNKAPSVPRRQTDYYHFLALKNNQVISSCGSEMPAYLKQCMSLKGWITMLEPHYMTDLGALCIEENRSIRTRIYIACWDLDVTGAYPTNTIVGNVGRDTQTKFIICVKDIDEAIVRKTTLNFSGGPVNSISIMQDMMGMPTLQELLDHYYETIE